MTPTTIIPTPTALSSRARRVLSALQTLADDDGHLVVGIPEILAEAGITPVTYRLGCVELEYAGLLERRRQYGAPIHYQIAPSS